MVRPTKTGLDAGYLRRLLVYYPENGNFFWTKTGLAAGSIKDGKYWVIRIDGIQYYAHRLAWVYMTGKWPEELIDHKNCKGLDNRWGNLRQANYSHNARNSTGYGKLPKGVYRSKQRFSASITVDRQVIYLGHFKTPDLAHAAYCRAAKKYHKEYARTK